MEYIYELALKKYLEDNTHLQPGNSYYYKRYPTYHRAIYLEDKDKDKDYLPMNVLPKEIQEYLYLRGGYIDYKRFNKMISKEVPF